MLRLSLMPFFVLTFLLTTAVVPATAEPSASAYPRLTRDELVARYRQPAGHVVEISGVEVYYEDEGHGSPILLVPGSVSTLRSYDGLACRLKAHHRVIRYDIPPSGLSGPVSDAAAARLKPADIAAGLLDHLELKGVTVIGVSSGGTLGVFLAAGRPDLVGRLVLSNTPADPVDTSQLRQPASFLALQKEAAQAHYQSLAFWNAFFDYFSGKPARISAQTREEYYDFNRRVPEKHVIDLVAQVADHAAAVAALNAVRAPTLLVWGGADPLLTPPTAEALRHYLNHAEVSLVTMPDVGHFPPLEAPGRFARIVDGYLKRTPS